VPRNLSDEAPEWPDDDAYPDLTEVLERLELAEDLDQPIFPEEDE
jgi:hypothetical protein